MHKLTTAVHHSPDHQTTGRPKLSAGFPYCCLKIEWTREEEPIKLEHVVDLTGTKGPSNYFCIKRTPEGMGRNNILLTTFGIAHYRYNNYKLLRSLSYCAELLLPDCIRFSCCSALHDCIDPLELLLPVCVRFTCCSRLRPFQLLLYCIRFGCCSPIASASTTAPRLRPIQLQLPDCVCIDCCSPPAVLEDSSPCPMFSNILRRVQGSVNRRIIV